MPSNGCVECVTPDGGITHYSKKYPGRCVKEALFGFAMYICDGAVGVHGGITDQFGAFRWLAGYELSEIHHYKVFQERETCQVTN